MGIPKAEPLVGAVTEREETEIEGERFSWVPTVGPAAAEEAGVGTSVGEET